MFWRKKKITFRDWALSTILADVNGSPRISASTTIRINVMAMGLGIAVGAQFPAKVLPIIRQVEGGETERGYAQMKERLERKIALTTKIDKETRLRVFPPIAELMETIKSRGIEDFTQHQFVQSVQGTFYYGLLTGSLHRTLSLEALEGFIEATFSEPATAYQRFLADIREVLASYENEHGTLS